MSDIWGKNEPINQIACRTCRHYNRENMTAFSCKAFENIPDEILVHNNPHTMPLPGQSNAIVYEAD